MLFSHKPYIIEKGSIDMYTLIYITRSRVFPSACNFENLIYNMYAVEKKASFSP